MDELELLMTRWPSLSAETRRAIVVLATLDAPGMVAALTSLILAVITPQEK